MTISEIFKAKCAGCHEPIVLYRYVGIPDGLYGSHHCDKQINIPEDKDLFYDLVEVNIS